MKQRVITAIVFYSIFMAFTLIGTWPFQLFVVALALICLYELMRMKGIKPNTLTALVGLGATAIYVIGSHALGLTPGIDDINVLIAAMVILIVLMVFLNRETDIDDIALIVFGIFYVGNGFQTLIWVRNTHLSLMLYLMVIIWSTDVGAYLCGRRFGKRKLAPSISPNKTVEGMIGGLFVALITAYLYIYIFKLEASFLANPLIIISLSFAGQLGDLIESSIKRSYQVKDSGDILPGHGGMFDRFDSTIFVMNVVKLLLYMF